MRFAKKLTVLVLASIPLGCPGDDTAPVDDDSSSTGDGSEDDASNTNSVTITTVDPDSSSGSSSDSVTMTTVDPDSSGDDSSSTDPTDPTKGEESSSSTDPTKGEESSSSTDPTKGEESSSSTDPTDATATGTTTDPTDASSESGTGGVGDCFDDDLGSAVPITVDIDTTLLDNTFDPTECSAPGSPDATYLFTAPAAGSYYFTTSRPPTNFNTAVYLLDGCDGGELVCDDDAGEGLQSLAILDMAAGQAVIVVVDGHNGAFGTTQLYIDAIPAVGDGGGCCTATDGVGGCDTDPVQECVCGFDDACCTGEWDADCVTEAVDICNADCGAPPACGDLEADGCNAPDNDCSCVGCNPDGACGFDDDCTCNDCDADGFCGNPLNCVDDGVCNPYSEGCVCDDCADEVVCIGGVDACAIGDASVFTDAVGGAIADNATLVLPLNVSGVDASTWDVTLTVQITHTYAADLDIALRSPSGTLIPVSTDNGGNNDNVYNGTVFSDNATTPITDIVFANLVVVPSAIPEGAFGAVRSEDPNGSWQLEVGDDATGDIGTVLGWSLSIAAVDPAPTFDAVASFSTVPALFFDEVAPAVSTIAVDGPARVCDLNVTTNVSHTYSSDMVMTLTSPSGTTTTLASGLGGALDNVFAGTTWNDGSPQASDNVFVNNVASTPLNPEGALSAFLGEDATGDWTLTVSDLFATDDGTLNSWSIDITSCDCQ